MKNVKILDCTLRDGGRIIKCAFPDEHIKGITKGLTQSKVDIIEMGFLRGNVEYKGNSTFFTEIDQFKEFIPKNRGKTIYVAFADYGEEFGMWDFSKLPNCDGTSITGIRVGFRKKDLYNAIGTFEAVKEKGYKLFVQGVESLSYTDREMLELIDVINKVNPHSFGIVDTFGSMYKDDVIRLYNLVNHNLNEDISIDFHSHNNMQLSFSFAQEIVECSQGKRKVIIDATMEGMGGGAGNLNTELIIDYLIRKHNYNYDIDTIFDTIDEYLIGIKQKHSWTYQIPHFMAGIFSSHANNIMYLTEKHRLRTKDIKHIISMIEPEMRKRYNYENIEKLYIEYFNSKIDDCDNLNLLQEQFKDKKILILVPGHTLIEHSDKIKDIITSQNPIVISVNFIYGKHSDEYVFFGNQRRYEKFREELEGINTILTSNVSSERETDIIVNYNNLVKRGVKYFDNTTIMLLRLLNSIGINDIMVAGFDGFSEYTENDYFDNLYASNRYNSDFEQINNDLEILLKEYAGFLEDKSSIKFVTPSRFEYIFKK